MKMIKILLSGIAVSIVIACAPNVSAEDGNSQDGLVTAGQDQQKTPLPEWLGGPKPIPEYCGTVTVCYVHDVRDGSDANDVVETYDGNGYHPGRDAIYVTRSRKCQLDRMELGGRAMRYCESVASNWKTCTFMRCEVLPNTSGN